MCLVRQIGIDSHTTPIFHTFFYIYKGEIIMPPRVLASGPKPRGGGGKNGLLYLGVM